MAIGNRQDFEIRSGDDTNLVVTVSGVDGLGVIISGATNIWWQLGKLAMSSNGTPIPASPGNPLLSKSLASGNITISGLSGFVVAVSGSAGDLDTNPLNRGGNFYHESQLLLNGKRTTDMYGICTVLPDLIEE